MTPDDVVISPERSAFDAEAKARHHLPEEIDLAKLLGFRFMGYFHEACIRNFAVELCGMTHDDVRADHDSLHRHSCHPDRGTQGGRDVGL